METHVALTSGTFTNLVEAQNTGFQQTDKVLAKLDENPNQKGATSQTNTDSDKNGLMNPIDERGTLFDALF